MQALLEYVRALGASDRFEGQPYNACTYADPDLRAAWQEGWREQDAKPGNQPVQRYRH